MGKKYITPEQIKEWSPRPSAHRKKVISMKDGLSRQFQAGKTVEELGKRIHRLLRMTDERKNLNGNWNSVLEELGIVAQMPSQVSDTWYSTESDDPGTLPSKKEIDRIRAYIRNDRKQRTWKKDECMYRVQSFIDVYESKYGSY